MNEKTTLLYVRVSTLDQVGGAESQTRSLTEWCQKNNIGNYEIFADHGISGAKESRPSLNQLMEKVKTGTVSQVVVFAFSRFARSTTHLLKALEFFRSQNVYLLLFAINAGQRAREADLRLLYRRTFNIRQASMVTIPNGHERRSTPRFWPSSGERPLIYVSCP